MKANESSWTFHKEWLVGPWDFVTITIIQILRNVHEGNFNIIWKTWIFLEKLT